MKTEILQVADMVCLAMAHVISFFKQFENFLEIASLTADWHQSIHHIPREEYLFAS